MTLPSRSRCHAEADRLLQPTTLQQRLHARVLAAEVAVQGGEVDGVAAREDLVAEDLAVLAGQAAVLLEPFERVVVEHLGPEVGVVAGRVAADPTELLPAACTAGATMSIWLA